VSLGSSLVLVTHHSSAFVPAAVASFRRELRSLGGGGEVVIVDHSEDPGELRRLRAVGPEHLLPQPNRGYAAGLNAGIAAASGEHLLLANPDVALEEGCLGALLAALAQGWQVVGPQFAAGPFELPPADPQRPGEELLRWLAGRSSAIWPRVLAREIRRWQRVWASPEPVAVPTLSGALLAVRAETARRLGPLDEGYFLYFEETDWLRRLPDGKAVVPRARAFHAWGHGGRAGDLEPVFAASRRRFYGRHFGLAGRLVARLPGRRPAVEPAAEAPGPPLPSAGELLWLASPAALGFPAAGARASRWRPDDAAQEFRRHFPRCRDVTVTAWDPAARQIVGVWLNRAD
jgi:GT2 family glycosyltransferase